MTIYGTSKLTFLIPIRLSKFTEVWKSNWNRLAFEESNAWPGEEQAEEGMVDILLNNGSGMKSNDVPNHLSI